jgi:hypothetical protein
LQVGDGLVAGFLGVMKRAGERLHLSQIGARDAAEPRDEPVGEPAEPEGHEQDDGDGDDELKAIHAPVTPRLGRPPVRRAGLNRRVVERGEGRRLPAARLRLGLGFDGVAGIDLVLQAKLDPRLRSRPSSVSLSAMGRVSP